MWNHCDNLGISAISAKSLNSVKFEKLVDSSGSRLGIYCDPYTIGNSGHQEELLDICRNYWQAMPDPI